MQCFNDNSLWDFFVPQMELVEWDVWYHGVKQNIPESVLGTGPVQQIKSTAMAGYMNLVILGDVVWHQYQFMYQTIT